MKAFLSSVVPTIVVTSFMFFSVAKADIIAKQDCGRKYLTEVDRANFISEMASQAQQVILTSTQQARKHDMNVPDVKLQELIEVPASPLKIGGFETLDYQGYIYNIEYDQIGETLDKVQILAQCDRKADVPRVLSLKLVRGDTTYTYIVRYYNGQLSFSDFSRSK